MGKPTQASASPRMGGGTCALILSHQRLGSRYAAGQAAPLLHPRSGAAVIRKRRRAKEKTALHLGEPFLAISES